MTDLTPFQAQQRIAELRSLRTRIDNELLSLGFRATRQDRPRRSPKEVPACGTESGYQRHHYRGEKCDECRAAHAEYTRGRYAAAKRMASGRRAS